MSPYRQASGPSGHSKHRRQLPVLAGVDSRLIADEFFRPSYTSGIWAKGKIVDRLRYQAMVGNNLGTLGVPPDPLDNGFNTLSSALIWIPTGEYGPGIRRLREHENAVRLVSHSHFSRSDENRESRPDNECLEHAVAALGRHGHLHARSLRPRHNDH